MKKMIFFLCSLLLLTIAPTVRTAEISSFEVMTNIHSLDEVDSSLESSLNGQEKMMVSGEGHGGGGG